MSEGGGYHKVTLSQINSYDAWNKSWIIQYDVFAHRIDISKCQGHLEIPPSESDLPEPQVWAPATQL